MNIARYFALGCVRKRYYRAIFALYIFKNNIARYSLAQYRAIFMNIARYWVILSNIARYCAIFVRSSALYFFEKIAIVSWKELANERSQKIQYKTWHLENIFFNSLLESNFVAYSFISPNDLNENVLNFQILKKPS